MDIPGNYVIGANLGVDHLTSAYFNSSNHIVNVVSIDTTQEWKDFFLDTLKVKRSSDERTKHANEERVEELMTRTLSTIRRATEASLHGPVKILAIAYPEHFKGQPYISTLVRTAMKSYPEIKDPMQVQPYLNCIRLAYRLDTPEALGYAEGDDLEEFNALVLHFDWQSGFLEGSLMGVTTPVHLREGVFRIYGFIGPDNVASEEDLTEFRTKTSALIDKELHNNSQYQTQLSDFRGIIFSGGATLSEFQKLRKAIIDLFPQFADKFRESIDPKWVAATGAAGLARNFNVKLPDSRAHFSCLFTRYVGPPDDPKDAPPIWGPPMQ